jgi:outer membrane lipoprotein-sorting protein
MEAGTGDSNARSAMYVANTFSTHNGKPTPQAIARAEQVNEKIKAAPQMELPFVLDMKRPNKSRIELVFSGKTAVQVYDGKQGWKLRPYLNRNDYEPFTADETKSQAGLWDLDGPLIDYAAKGTKVEADGVEAVEGHDAYKLKVTLKSGRVEHVWVDAQSFLDVKVEGTPRHMDGKMRTVWVFQRDFRKVDGVLIPFVLETAVEGYPNTHKMALEKVTVNPKLDESLFTKPAA